jgi:hypothetical protein
MEKNEVGNLTKIAVALVVSGLIYVISSVVTQNTMQAQSDIKDEYLKDRFDSLEKKVDEFTAVKRFTSDDFDVQIKPLIKQLNMNTAELNARSNFMQTTESRLLKLEFIWDNHKTD